MTYDALEENESAETLGDGNDHGTPDYELPFLGSTILDTDDHAVILGSDGIEFRAALGKGSADVLDMLLSSLSRVKHAVEGSQIPGECAGWGKPISLGVLYRKLPRPDRNTGSTVEAGSNSASSPGIHDECYELEVS